MTEQKTERDLGTCIMGAATDTPCPRPAVRRWRNSTTLCEEHYRVAEVGEHEDELTLSLELLEAWIYEVRGYGCGELENGLEQISAGLQERLKDTSGLLGVLERSADRQEPQS